MDKPRLLVIGASGFLGAYAVHAAEATGRFEVLRGGRAATAEVGSEPRAGVVEVQLADLASVDAAFQKARPDFVLLLAAISDIDRCERSPDEAYAVNVRGAEHVADACARSDTRLLFSSSAAVFDGTRQGYCEEDVPNPLSVYGKTKLIGEQVIQKRVPSAVILRFALVLGFARRSGTNAMLNSTMASWQSGKPVTFSTREDRNPIDAATLGQIMMALLANTTFSGVYHAGAADSVSRYELGLRLAARAGVPSNLVIPQDEPVPGRAPRGQHHFLLPHKLAEACGLKLQATDEVIERCFS
jgi:dTDP-4-dehydrorhamnose reductase